MLRNGTSTIDQRIGSFLWLVGQGKRESRESPPCMIDAERENTKNFIEWLGGRNGIF